MNVKIAQATPACFCLDCATASLGKALCWLYLAFTRLAVIPAPLNTISDLHMEAARGYPSTAQNFHMATAKNHGAIPTTPKIRTQTRLL